MKKYTERNNVIVEHFKQSGSLIKTGKEFGLTDERVRQIAKAEGVLTKDVRKVKAKQLLESVKDTLGLSTSLSPKDSRQIAHHLGVSYKQLKERNLQEAILECYEAGMCRVEIAKHLNVHYRTVSKYLSCENMPKGCLRGGETKERDAKLYADWKIIHKNEGQTHSLAQVARKYNMTYENAYYCVKRHLFNNIHTKQKIK